MIDIEFDVFDTVADELRVMYPDIFVTGDLSASPAQFPAVSIVEINNSVINSVRTTNIENAARVAYEVNVYSDKIGYNKMEAKSILAVADGVFSRMGFTRTFCNPIQNLENRNVYRIVARYEAIVDKNFWIYQS